jgi:hypothetical protein
MGSSAVSYMRNKTTARFLKYAHDFASDQTCKDIPLFFTVFGSESVGALRFWGSRVAFRIWICYYLYETDPDPSS